MRFLNKKIISLIILFGISAVGFVLYANSEVETTTWASVRDTVDKLPYRAVGLVPGTRPGGTYFRNRIDSAAGAYLAGKVKWLIVSGDNRHADYNEPQEMQKALIDKGVPESAIYCDYAGFTTLDSVLRARDVFGQTRVTIISQQFQNQRAIYLAQHYGIDAVGLNAADVPAAQQRVLRTVREYVARARAVLDANIIRRRPHFSGPTITPGTSSVERCPAM